MFKFYKPKSAVDLSRIASTCRRTKTVSSTSCFINHNNRAHQKPRSRSTSETLLLCNNSNQHHTSHRYSDFVPNWNARSFSTSSDSEHDNGSICFPDEIPTTEQLQQLHSNINKAMTVDHAELQTASRYYFDGKGKLLRPLIVTLVGRACRDEGDIDASQWPDQIEQHQNSIARITEMIHTASLVHDDVIDEATSRRNSVSVNRAFTEKQCVLAGDFILARATYLLAKIGHPRVIEIFAQVIEDLVRGELMQLGTAQDPEQRFQNYLKKSEAKTARLLARSCHCVAVLAGGSEELETAAYEYGRHLGIAFQLIDDLLDVVQTSADMGKETSVDMKLGLSTAPVLYASEQFPELVPMMMRQFREDGDVARARELIMNSDGLERTRLLAADYANEAVRQAEAMPGSEVHKSALIDIAQKLLRRTT